MPKATLQPINGPVIQRVVLVDRITRSKPERFKSHSLPGHLLHFVISGRVSQVSDGRTQMLTPLTTGWYFENESTQGEILEAPWTFYTVVFEAATLAPPPEHLRIQPATFATASKFESLYEAWHDANQSEITRHVRVHLCLLDLLLELLPATQPQSRHRLDTQSLPWWKIETLLRGKLHEHIDLPFLQKLSGLSQRSILESCARATGTTPIKRVKELRLTYARGLVQHSSLTVSEIAYRVGYSRVQELSRDYHERFDITPREDRVQSPLYQELQHPDDGK